jgi:hypothetical protein
MKKLTWGIIFVCILCSASFAAEPDPAGTTGTTATTGAEGGAAKGADPAGWGNSTDRATVITVTTIVILTGIGMAAILSGSDDSTSTTGHVP